MSTIPTEGSGKGDTPRRVNRYHYGSNYDEIDWGSTKLPRKRKRKKFDWPSVLGDVPKIFTTWME